MTRITIALALLAASFGLMSMAPGDTSSLTDTYNQSIEANEADIQAFSLPLESEVLLDYDGELSIVALSIETNEHMLSFVDVTDHDVSSVEKLKPDSAYPIEHQSVVHETGFGPWVDGGGEPMIQDGVSNQRVTLPSDYMSSNLEQFESGQEHILWTAPYKRGANIKTGSYLS